MRVVNRKASLNDAMMQRSQRTTPSYVQVDQAANTKHSPPEFSDPFERETRSKRKKLKVEISAPMRSVQNTELVPCDDDQEMDGALLDDSKSLETSSVTCGSCEGEFSVATDAGKNALAALISKAKI